MTLLELQKEATHPLKKGTYARRSCWKCNPAHGWMKDDKETLFNCFMCGRWFYKGQDITAHGEGCKCSECKESKEGLCYGREIKDG